MSYNMKELPNYIQTAGKITVITSLVGVVVFAVIFLLNIGANELKHAEAQSNQATTSVTVLNTPPQWTVDAQESTPSSTTTPTNSGSAISWTARATDSNGESYYLLICSNGNAPTANPSAAPTCGSGAVRWAVSAFTASGATSTAATTTTEVAPFAEQNNWFAWVCDAVATNPRCNATSKQGTPPTNSPFNVNKRPTFTVFTDSSPALPGATVTFSTTASDPDTVPTNDTVRLFVCSTNSFNTSTDSCDALTLFSTTTLVASNPSGTYVIPIPTQDQNYDAFGFVVDNHGHEASGGAQGTNSTLTVQNAAPTVSAAQITLNGGQDLVLAVEAGETTGFDLQFVASDNNSCDAVGGVDDDEIVDYVLSVYRSGIGSTTCNGLSGYNANNCYPSEVGTSTWNLSCTASSTSCTGSTDTTIIYDCTFPLWYIADPTDVASTSLYAAQDWRAAVRPIDDDGASSTLTQSSTSDIDVLAFLSMALDTFAIPYGSLEPGQRTDPLAATTEVRATGNVGIDELLTGSSMCTTYTNAVTCPTSATSTIAESFQVFATSSVSYGTATATGRTLSSTTNKRLDLNVQKSIATSTQATGTTYWGIHVPITLTLSGAYTGENTFYVAGSDPSQW
jgi:hypothetical protein